MATTSAKKKAPRKLARGLYPATESSAARTHAQAVADRFAAMSPAKRRKAIAAFEEIKAKSRPPHAPTDEAVKSDLLTLLNAIAAEFVRRYYPDATDASIHVTKYPPTPDMPEYSVSLPIAVPANAKDGEPEADPPAADSQAEAEPVASSDEVEKRYRRMVAAVREWLAVEYPRTSPDRVDICLFGDNQGGESIAWFHASADDPYVLGDLRALEPTD